MKGSWENMGQNSGFRYIEVDWDYSKFFVVLKFIGLKSNFRYIEVDLDRSKLFVTLKFIGTEAEFSVH